MEVSAAPTVLPSAFTHDGAGQFACPGLIDAHVHVNAISGYLGDIENWSQAYTTAHAARRMHEMLARGFTSVRDTAGADYGLAQAVDEELFIGPRLFFGGRALSQTGGHADFCPPSVTHDPHQCCAGVGVVCDGVSAVRRAAREQLRTGAFHIKVMLSGGVSSPTDRIDSTQFSDEEIRAAVEEASAFNRYGPVTNSVAYTEFVTGPQAACNGFGLITASAASVSSIAPRRSPVP
ncbi:amidohydrolase family protein [Saccharopolyspora pogona]|uniref:amidohydrolase family protein n=1 Tax=Saccharopolyspora pogona TaxID=333966 RepID=UPI00168817C5|nr:amidohydrolase family protein [Saccharopolyspora pogona]